MNSWGMVPPLSISHKVCAHCLSDIKGKEKEKITVGKGREEEEKKEEGRRRRRR